MSVPYNTFPPSQFSINLFSKSISNICVYCSKLQASVCFELIKTANVTNRYSFPSIHKNNKIFTTFTYINMQIISEQKLVNHKKIIIIIIIIITTQYKFTMLQIISRQQLCLHLRIEKNLKTVEKVKSLSYVASMIRDDAVPFPYILKVDYLF